ncbi:hypothetical protein GOP47_0015094 [Adiantum capillus-veneris]|uniref:Uncharacterized protein n=1 Tax=Adiantum capillus-veneris TaxID=13818 RepID=A0A9D4ZFE1_ADICA|nr:hypothetical protein GOP47_0015094 [Adiantum capillus-veneris]
MTSHIKKESRLQGYIDQGYFDPVVSKNPYCAGQIIFDSGYTGGDVPTTPEKETFGLPTPPESPPFINAYPATGVCNTTRHTNPQFNMVQCDGKLAVTSSANKKRKRQPAESIAEETDDFKSQLYSMLETSSRLLTAHVESQNANSQLDRNQRKEHMDSLVNVLGKLADAVGKLAERL